MSLTRETFVDFKLQPINESRFRDLPAIGLALAQRLAAVLGPLHHNKVAMVNYVEKDRFLGFVIKTDEKDVSESARPSYKLMMPGSCDGQVSQHWRLIAIYDDRWSNETVLKNLKETVAVVLYWI